MKTAGAGDGNKADPVRQRILDQYAVCRADRSIEDPEIVNDRVPRRHLGRRAAEELKKRLVLNPLQERDPLRLPGHGRDHFRRVCRARPRRSERIEQKS